MREMDGNTQEFDMEIQPMNLVRGQGLWRMIADSYVDDERKFTFDSKTNAQDQENMIVSQVDID